MTRVTFTNADKVFWPAVGLTKAFVRDWYVEVAPVLLPHLAGHPLSLHRFPDGVDGPHWYDTRCPHPPPWLRVHRMPFASGKSVDACVIDDVDGLVWAAQTGTIELHPFLDPVDAPGRPDVVVFDLDPGAPAGPLDAAAVALRVRDVLDAVGLVSAPKTTGGAGVHVYAPVAGATYDDTKAFARAVAALLVRETPAHVTDRMPRVHRPGKVFVDWSQNDAGKSTVAPYSLRGQRVPTVSTPVAWDELEIAVDSGEPARLLFTPDAVRERIDRRGDVFDTVLATTQRLPTGATPATPR